MKVLLGLLLTLIYCSVGPVAQAASPGAGLTQAQKDAEAKGFRLEGNREEIIAKAKKEGGLRALLGFDKPTIVALRDGFRKKYPFINPHFEEHGNPAESQRYLFVGASGLKGGVKIECPRYNESRFRATLGGELVSSGLSMDSGHSSNDVKNCEISEKPLVH